MARVYVRGLEGINYNLRDAREERLSVPRVRSSDERGWTAEEDSKSEGIPSTSHARQAFAPGDNPFLTQSLHVHFVQIDPNGADSGPVGGHGHQNEAAFYVLEGRGYSIHDGQRYDWKAGDLLIVHADSKHQNVNADPDRHALLLVMKAKPLWLFLGLTQQGTNTTIPRGREDDFGPREDWSGIWTPGVESLPKVIRGEERPWEITRDGRVKHVINADIPSRLFAADIYLQDIEGGSRSAKHWHMADEILYVMQGSGYSDQWRVEADIDDRFYARIAKQPDRYQWKAGDFIYVPQNTAHQHVANPGETVRLLSVQNRVFKLIGYNAVRYLEDAPEYAGSKREPAGVGR